MYQMRNRDYPIDNYEGIPPEPTREQQLAVINTLIRHDALDLAEMILAPLNPTVERRRYPRKATA